MSFDELCEKHLIDGFIPVFNPGCSDLDIVVSGIFNGGFLFPRTRQWFAEIKDILERGLHPLNGYTVRIDGSVVLPHQQPPKIRRGIATPGNIYDLRQWSGRNDIKVGDEVEWQSAG